MVVSPQAVRHDDVWFVWFELGTYKNLLVCEQIAKSASGATIKFICLNIHNLMQLKTANIHSVCVGSTSSPVNHLRLVKYK